MGENEKTGKLMVRANRLGTTAEITTFLNDFESAYVALYLFYFYSLGGGRKHLRHIPLGVLIDIGFPFPTAPLRQAKSEAILPEHQLTLSRISIKSPGFWEFLGSLNPLQQIREYLNDRHSRKKDQEFRNDAERERLRLENELLQRQIAESDNSILKERISLLRELGYSDQEIRQIVWTNIGNPLAQLGRHQDTGLIENVD